MHVLKHADWAVLYPVNLHTFDHPFRERRSALAAQGRVGVCEGRPLHGGEFAQNLSPPLHRADDEWELHLLYVDTVIEQLQFVSILVPLRSFQADSSATVAAVGTLGASAPLAFPIVGLRLSVVFQTEYLLNASSGDVGPAVEVLQNRHYRVL
jgi:hypothetical protein